MTLAFLFLSWFPFNGGDGESETNQISEPAEVGDGEERPSTSNMSQREIKREIYKVERRLDRTQERISDHKQKYRQHIIEGSKTETTRRKVFAMRARMEKFKAKVYHLKALKFSRDLQVLVMAEAQKEMQELVGEIDTNRISDVLDLNPADLEAEINEFKDTIAIDIRELDSAMDQLDVAGSDIGMNVTEEEKLMDMYASSEGERADLDFDFVDVTDDESQAVEETDFGLGGMEQTLDNLEEQLDDSEQSSQE